MNRTTDRRLAIALVLLVSGASGQARAQSAKALLDKVVETERKRSEGVSDYAMDITIMGHETTQYYERVTIPVPGGKPMETFRLVSFGQVDERTPAQQGMTPEAWQAYSDGLRRTGSGVDAEMQRGLNEAGLPPGLLDGGGQAEPWASPNPAIMMDSMAGFTDAAAGANQARENDDETAIAQSMLLFRKKARIVGKETIDKRSAIHARAEDLNVVEEVDGERLTIHAISLWVDAQKLVPLKMRMEGAATREGQSRKVFLERLDQDYRTVPNSKLYMPYRSLMRMAGLFGPSEREQMKDARKQLEELDEQLASMPPEERARMERMVGPQIQMMRNMVDGGEMEVVTKVRAIRVNVGLPEATATAPPSKPDSAPSGSAKADPAAQSREEAQAECLQQKIDAMKKKKRAFGSLLRAAGNAASRYGGAQVTGEVERASQEAYKADATAKDLEEAAKTLGLSTEDVEACRNPK